MIDYKKYLPLLIIGLGMFFVISMYSNVFFLPMADDMAVNNVHSYVKQQITAAIEQQYPQISGTQKDNMIEEQLSKVNWAQYDVTIQSVSQQIKDFYQDKDGKTYMIDIDPYLWYGEAGNLLKYGHYGTEVIDGNDINFLRNGRIGREMSSIRLHTYVIAGLYSVIHIFYPITLMYAQMLVPMLIISLSLIPCFFIGRKFAGNIGGFFSVLLICFNATVISRSITPDTDIYNVFFPLWIMWFFLLGWDAETFNKKVIFLSLAGLFTGLFSYAWLGWWYFFVFIISGIFIYSVYLFIKKSNFFIIWKNNIIVLLIYTLVTFVFVSLFQGVHTFFDGLTAPFDIFIFKGIRDSIWPNVLTTVAEFNEINFMGLFNQLGGFLITFIGVLGLLLFFKKKMMKEAIFFIICLVGGAYAFTKGVRFSLLLIPAFAVLFGIGIYFLYKIGIQILGKIKVNQTFIKIFILIMLCLIIFPSYNYAKYVSENMGPMFNDNWQATLDAIKNNSSDGIISSWWDFGHWFVAMGERRTTFDGAYQGKRIYWIGKSLVTNNEEEAVNILRMLNCGQEEAYNELLKLNNGDEYKTITRLNQLLGNIEPNPDEREIYYKYIKCDNLIPQYYIFSEDMVGKAPVWAHFGLWNFEKAQLWQDVRKGKVNTSDKIKNEIMTTSADQWVSPWPQYGKTMSCIILNESIKCGDIEIDRVNMYSSQVRSIDFVINEKFYHVENKNNMNSPYSLAFFGNSAILMDYRLSDSIFTRAFFFQGIGLEHFKPLYYAGQNGQQIYTYKVELDDN